MKMKGWIAGQAEETPGSGRRLPGAHPGASPGARPGAHPGASRLGADQRGVAGHVREGFLVP